MNLEHGSKVTAKWCDDHWDIGERKIYRWCDSNLSPVSDWFDNIGDVIDWIIDYDTKRLNDV